MGIYHLRALDATRGLARVFVYIAWSMPGLLLPPQWIN